MFCNYKMNPSSHYPSQNISIPRDILLILHFTYVTVSKLPTVNPEKMSVKIISIKTLPKKSQVVTIKQERKKTPPASSKDIIIIQPSKSKELTSPKSQPSQSKKLVLPTSQPHQSKVLSSFESFRSKSKDLVLPTSQPFQSKVFSPLRTHPSKSKDLVPPKSQPVQSKDLSPLKSKDLALPAASKTSQPKELVQLPTFHIVPKGGKPLIRRISTKPRIISKSKLMKSIKSIDATVPESPLKKIPEKVLSESFANPNDPEKKTPEKLKSKIDSHIESNKDVKVVIEKLPATASSALLKIPVQMKKDRAPVITVAKSKSHVPAVTKDMPIITSIDVPTDSGPMEIKDMPIITDISQPYDPIPMTIDNMPVIIGEPSQPIHVIIQQLPQTGNLFKQRGAMQVMLENVPKVPSTSVESKSSMQVTLQQAPQASTSVECNVTKIVQKMPKISNITSLANVNIMEFLPTSEPNATVIEPMEFNFDESLLLGNPAETVQNNPGKLHMSF